MFEKKKIEFYYLSVENMKGNILSEETAQSNDGKEPQSIYEMNFNNGS